MRNEDNHLATILAGVTIFMLAVAFASVPLYRLICKKTGFGGTPQIALTTSDKMIDREITVQFTASTHRDLPWEFRPMQHDAKIKIGENGLAYFYAKNKSDKPIVGMATYNVSPDKAAIYFNKVQCFCFEQQKLDPGETMEMPVQFFIDPAFANDPLLKSVNEITLSYSFFVFKKQ